MHDKDGDKEPLHDFWTLSPEQIATHLDSNPGGLTTREAEERLKKYGRNELREQESLSRWRVFRFNCCLYLPQSPQQSRVRGPTRLSFLRSSL